MVFLVVSVSVASAAGLPLPQTAYLQRLIARAQTMGLAARREWLALGLYRANLLRGYRSQADGPGFFLAKNGRYHPHAELDATLSAFFSQIQSHGQMQNPQCRYVARYHWLNQQLHFDPRLMPRHRCLRFHRWYKALDPVSVSVVFPAADVNNPSSMFGHLFLRVNSARWSASSPLLAYSVSYAADIKHGDGGVLFAYNGLFGGYRGEYTMSPYYAKVREYASFDNRDMWVYPLKLTPSQMRQLIRQVWELGPTRFRYYFFSQNCASQALDLVAVADPSQHLFRPFHGWVIPTDAVRVLARDHLLGTPYFHPSARTRLEWRLAGLRPSERPLVDPVSRGLRPAIFVALSPEEQSRVLNAAYAYAHYRMRRHPESKARGAAMQRALLVARSKLPDAPVQPLPAPPPVPQAGHDSERFMMSTGMRDHTGYQELSWRPAYQDLLDPGAGYTPGAEIGFLNTIVRRYSDSGRVQLQKLDVIDIKSLTVRNALFHPWSWQVNTGFMRRPVDPQGEQLLYDVVGGAGVTYGNLDHFAVYGFVDSGAETGPSLADHYAVGIGPEIGLLAHPTAHWRIQVFARDLRYGLGDRHTEAEAGIRQSYTLSRDQAVRVEFYRKRQFGRSWSRYDLAWAYYFL